MQNRNLIPTHTKENKNEDFYSLLLSLIDNCSIRFIVRKIGSGEKGDDLPGFN